ncbi:MAG TPA: glycerate kinase [Chthoniobacterales bacterium]|nr:glycerate kinase [Chthoniobacterales bacterium]
MRILIAPDKFKGSLSAGDVADCIAAGLRDVLPDATIEVVPVADGGEGTAALIGEACGGEWITCPAHDALGRAIDARYVCLPDRATAVIEMSAAAGIWRIAPDERDLLRANTSGVGEMMKDAAKRGAKEILIGLGGSATNDGGFGMARALGFRFYGAEHPPLRSSGEAGEHELERPGDLNKLTRIFSPDASGNLTALSRQVCVFPKISAAVDVRNPLLGPRGATHTFGRQKGGTPDELEILETALKRLADVVRRDLGSDFRDTPGAGAAGGLGFGLMSFCGAMVRPGFDLVAEMVGLEAAVRRADVVITGEGSLDQQTLEGKAPAGVARLARKMGKRVFAIVGCAADGGTPPELFDGILVLAIPPIAREESMARTAELLQERARELAQMM